MVNSNDDFALEIAARVKITAQNASSCAQLIELGRILGIENLSIRRERLRIHLHQYRSELIAELAAFGIELEWPTRNVLETAEHAGDWHDAIDNDPLNGKFEESDQQELFAAANRARAYIDSTF